MQGLAHNNLGDKPLSIKTLLYSYTNNYLTYNDDELINAYLELIEQPVNKLNLTELIKKYQILQAFKQRGLLIPETADYERLISPNQICPVCEHYSGKKRICSITREKPSFQLDCLDFVINKNKFYTSPESMRKKLYSVARIARILRLIRLIFGG
jgi:hypothetical protein